MQNSLPDHDAQRKSGRVELPGDTPFLHLPTQHACEVRVGRAFELNSLNSNHDQSTQGGNHVGT